MPKYRFKHLILGQPPSLSAGDQVLYPEKTAGNFKSHFLGCKWEEFFFFFQRTAGVSGVESLLNLYTLLPHSQGSFGPIKT